MWPGSDDDSEFEDGESEEREQEEPPCPFCGEVSSCGHLLAYATEGEWEWYGELRDPSFPIERAMCKAIYARLKAGLPKPTDCSAAMDDLLSIVDLDSFGGSAEGFEYSEDLTAYWISLASDLDAVQREEWDTDAGYPGGSGSNVALYVKDAKAAVATILANAQADLDSLRHGVE
jgi:hypothetical protein